MDCITCPEGQRTYEIHDSRIMCDGKTIPVLSAINTTDGLERAARPDWCPLDPKAVAVKKRSDMTVRDGCPGKRIFNDDQIRDIRAKYKDGLPVKDIAKQYNTSKENVRKVVSGKYYKDVV